MPNPVSETGAVQAVRPLPPVELRLPATRALLEPLASFVLSAATRFGLDQELASRLRLAVEEVAANVMDYGYAGKLSRRCGVGAGRRSEPGRAACPSPIG